MANEINDDDVPPITRGSRLHGLYRSEIRKPAEGSRARQRLLADMIARETPEDPIRSPLDELMRGPKE